MGIEEAAREYRAVFLWYNALTECERKRGRNEKAARRVAVEIIKKRDSGSISERIAAFICGVLLLVVLLITATQAVCYWIPGWWEKEYKKYDVTSYVTGEMSLDDAVYVTEEMLAYCIGDKESLDDVQATIDGKKGPFFTKREKLHLADCRELFIKGIWLRRISIVLMAGLLVLLALRIRKKRDGEWRPLYFRILTAGYIKAFIAVLIIAAILVIMGMSDFTYLFTKFHHVFFDNDLWQLNIRKDNLVNIMQEEVFRDAAITIGAIWGAIATLLLVVSAVCKR